jgi:hypothetical protein
MNVTALICLAILLRQIFGIKHLTRSTTAESARRWAFAAVLACLVCITCQWPLLGIPEQYRSALQYLAAVMLLTPFIAILGARRPGAGAWPWFVVLPLVAVLQWPLVSQMLAENAENAIEIPTPTLIGFLFVLVMGSGNYFGTINTGAALVCAVGTTLIVLPLSDWMSHDNSWSLPVGCALLTLAGSLLPGRYMQEAPLVQQQDGDLTALWVDFRDLYGIVWAKRVMDRVNQFAEREAWDVRMSLDGFTLSSDGTPTNSVPKRTVEILCWVLRRFVDAPFLRRYLPEQMVPRQTE